MGRTKKKTNKENKPRPGARKSSENAKACSVDDLLSQMESCVNELQYDQARELGESALRVEPNNLKVLDAFSSLLLEMGDSTKALELLQRMVQLEPDGGYRKYLSLGQLTDSKESLSHYAKGVEILCKLLQEQHGLAAGSEERSGADLNRALSSAYCAMAEIYMTDCCDEEDAEQQCSEFVQKSIQADPSNPEAFQVQANFLLVKQEHEAAKEAMQRSLDLWLPQHERLLLGEDAGNNDPVEVCPLSYSSRVNGAKVLIELEMFDEANTVLDGLVEEDDGVVDVWYLLGWLNYLRGGEYRGNARYYLNQAREVAHKVQFDDADELAHIEELLAELGPEPEEGDEEDKGSFVSESEEEEEAMEV
ncbi:hypothetical protein HPB50_011203 [Hyalomma asiaticum]|uniref:Uncharacterized protein n=1 Tax=Hyalomma asiaticum TaxID=266040 RepID=A0ACB7SUS8_HYAAI|nr:hypothetical protein HPB50_011203 [Hyalomma asiaticum]